MHRSSQPAEPTKATARSQEPGTESTRDAPPPLPAPRAITVDHNCAVEYIDIQSSNRISTETLTIVFLHGAPGSYNDFRYMIPILREHSDDSVRVIAVNLPGVGNSGATEPSDTFNRLHAQRAAESVYRALTEICRDDPNVFLVGHSFGGHAAINVAYAADQEKLLRVKGLALMASTGDRAHQTIYPRLCKVLASVVGAQIPLISRATQSLVCWIYTTIVGFPRAQPVWYYVTALFRHATTNFDHVTAQLRSLKHVPVFHAWAKNDRHVEEQLSERLGTLCGPGPRLAFRGGGHNIQKTRATQLADAMLAWMHCIVSGQEGAGSATRTTEFTVMN